MDFMRSPNYKRLGNEGYATSDVELTHSLKNDVYSTAYEHAELQAKDSSSPLAPRHLGVPRSKPRLDLLDISAVTISLVTLVVAVCSVTPLLSLSWFIGFDHQLIIIGFLLSLMNICMRRILPNLFLIVEERWGRSSLQNYDSIIQNTVTLSNTSFLWRLSLGVLILLPLGLSAGYKRFTNGRSGNVKIEVNLANNTAFNGSYEGYYGLSTPPLGNLQVVNNSIFYMINASAAFMEETSDPLKPFIPTALPMAYGYNSLLVDSTRLA